MVEHVRSLAVDSSLLGFLWIEAISTMNFLINCKLIKVNLGVTIKKNKLKTLHRSFKNLWLCCILTYISQKNKEKNLRTKQDVYF